MKGAEEEGKKTKEEERKLAGRLLGARAKKKPGAEEEIFF